MKQQITYDMRKVFSIVCIGLLCIACTPKQAGEEEAIRDLCTYISGRYPAATLQDVYKTCYQDYFGANHLMMDTAAAHRYLLAEIAACAEEDLSKIPPCEPTGFRHRFKRVNLSEVLNGSLSEEELFRAFADAAVKNNAFGEDWESEWEQIETVAVSVCPAWADSALRAELRIAAKAKSAVRHSDAFRKAYNPHYRIILNN